MPLGWRVKLVVREMTGPSSSLKGVKIMIMTAKLQLFTIRKKKKKKNKEHFACINPLRLSFPFLHFHHLSHPSSHIPLFVFVPYTLSLHPLSIHKHKA